MQEKASSQYGNQFLVFIITTRSQIPRSRATGYLTRAQSPSASKLAFGSLRTRELIPVTFMKAFLHVYLDKYNIRPYPLYITVGDDIFMIPPKNAKNLTRPRNNQCTDPSRLNIKINITDIAKPFPVTDIDHFLFAQIT